MTSHTPIRAAELFDLGLRLLDRQLVGSEDELFGNVDNALLETVDGELAVTALVCGPAALGPRFGGRTDVWMRSIWRRLRPERDPAPVVIPMTHVVSVGSAVTLDDHAQQLVADGAQLERWLRYYLISRIPGATGGPDRLAGEPIGPSNPRVATTDGPAGRTATCSATSSAPQSSTSEGCRSGWCWTSAANHLTTAGTGSAPCRCERWSTGGVGSGPRWATPPNATRDPGSLPLPCAPGTAPTGSFPSTTSASTGNTHRDPFATDRARAPARPTRVAVTRSGDDRVDRLLEGARRRGSAGRLLLRGQQLSPSSCSCLAAQPSRTLGNQSCSSSSMWCVTFSMSTVVLASKRSSSGVIWYSSITRTSATWCSS